MQLTAQILALHPRQVFRISRAARTEVRNVFVKIEHEGITAYGEASPNSFYNEDADAVLAHLAKAEIFLRNRKIRSVQDIVQAWEEIWPQLAPSRAAQCAVDVALWDWLARREGCTVCELAWGERPRPVPTFVTIGISTPEELEAKAAELQGFPFIKMKSDGAADIEPVRFVQEHTGAALAVDANCAWSERDVVPLSRKLASLGVRFIEQPFAPGDDARMPALLSASALPVFADESCVVREDVERMPGHFSGFNIKLTKCGGITPALAMLARAKELGLQTMVGCMLESSVLITAGAAVAQRTDYADLDGAWLIRDDPFRGVRYDKGVLHLEDRITPDREQT